MQPTYNHCFPNLPAASKVWIYIANREFTSEETKAVKELIATFVDQWTAHGADLYAGGDLFDQKVLVLAVNDEITGASGCSIDASYRFIKKICADFEIDLFDRLHLWLVNDQDELKRIHLSDLANYSTWKMYNPMIANLGDFRQNAVIKVEDSVLYQQFAR